MAQFASTEVWTKALQTPCSWLPLLGFTLGPVPCVGEKQYEAEDHAQGQEREREAA